MVATKLTDKIVDMLLDIPWDRREEVIKAVLYNGVFCPHCGYGERSAPNPDCQCQNDE